MRPVRTVVFLLALLTAGCPPPADPRLRGAPTPPEEEPPPADVLDVTLEPGGLPGGATTTTRPEMRPDRLQPAPPEGARADGLPPGRQQWSVLRLGRPLNVIPFVIVGEGPDAALYLDADRDGDLADEQPVRNGSNAASGFAARLGVPVRYAEATRELSVWLYTNETRGAYDVYAVGGWTGALRVAGRDYPLFLYEQACDGDFSDHPVWLDVNGDGALQRSERIQLGEQLQLGEHTLTLRSVAADGSRVVFEPADREAPARDLAEAVDAELRVKPFRFTDLGGTRIEVGEATQGKVVLLDFWATWCAPCLRDMPHVEALHATHGARPDFLLVGVSLDSDRAALEATVAERGLGWSQHFDGLGFKGPLPEAYGVSGIPATVLIDRKGRIVATNLRGEALAERVSALLDAR